MGYLFVLLHKIYALQNLHPGTILERPQTAPFSFHAFSLLSTYSIFFGGVGVNPFAPCFVAPTREQEIAYLMRPDERHTFPEHVTCGGSSNSSGLDEDSWSRTSPPKATVSSASDGASRSDSRNKGSNGFGGDARAKGRGKGKEKVTATSDAPVPGAGFNAVSAASAASAATATAEIYDLSGRRRKKLTYSQEIYR